MRRFKLPFYLMITLSAATFVVIQNRCRHDAMDASKLDPVCYDSQIAPIFLNSCSTTGCHNVTSHQAGYVFSDYASVMKAIKANSPYKSDAYLAMTNKGFKSLMPPSGALPENSRILVRVWIEQGATHTTCSSSNGGGNGGNGGGTVPLKVCFQRDLLPVLVSSCGISGCHDQTTHRSGYNITSYSTIMSSGLVRAGNPTGSTLYTITGNQSGEDIMPPRPYAPLAQAVRDSIYNWIKNGALNETCVSACDTAGVVTYAKQITTLVQKNCLACHNASNTSGNVRLDSYAQVKTYMDNGKLLAAVKGTTKQMPPSYKLTACEIRQLELWKSGGEQQ